MTKHFSFEGSYIDGPYIDVLHWANLHLDDTQHDKVFGSTNIEDIIELCSSAELEVTDVFEGGMPGFSDTFYRVTSEDSETFKSELREEIEKLLKS